MNVQNTEPNVKKYVAEIIILKYIDLTLYFGK